MAKNVLPKYWNGSEFEELHIVTKASNVFTNDNKSTQQKIDDFTSHLAAAAPHSGHETPAGVQAKAEAAAGAVQDELDAHVADNTAHGVNTRMPIAGGTFTGVVVAQTNTSYTTRQLRNVILSTSDPSGGSNGDIWIKYE